MEALTSSTFPAALRTFLILRRKIVSLLVSKQHLFALFSREIKPKGSNLLSQAKNLFERRSWCRTSLKSLASNLLDCAARTALKKPQRPANPMEKTTNTLILFSSKDSALPAQQRMLTHLGGMKNCSSPSRKIEFADIETPGFCLDYEMLKQLTNERFVVVILIGPSLVAHPLTTSRPMKELVAFSGPSGAHVFPIHCVAVEDTKELPWTELVWAPADRTKAISTCREMDEPCCKIIRQLRAVIEQRLLGPQPPAPDLAIYADIADSREVDEALTPMLKMARGLNYVRSWCVLPGERRHQFFERASTASNQVVLISARAIADDDIWDYMLARKPIDGQRRLLIYLFACAWEKLDFAYWPRTDVLPHLKGDERPTIGGKNSHALWRQACLAIAELVVGR